MDILDRLALRRRQQIVGNAWSFVGFAAFVLGGFLLGGFGGGMLAFGAASMVIGISSAVSA